MARPRKRSPEGGRICVPLPTRGDSTLPASGALFAKMRGHRGRGILDYRCVALALLILFHLVNNVYIVSRGNPLAGDVVGYLDSSLRMYSHLREGRIGLGLGVTGRFGPLYFYLTQPFYFLLGRSVLSASLLNTGFFALLVVCAYLLGKELHSDKAGLLSAFLVSFIPNAYGMSRVYGMDMPLAAVVCLDLYLLLRIRGLTQRRNTVLLAFSFGVSALIRPHFILYLAGPLAAVLLDGFRLDLSDPSARAKIGNLLLLVFLSLLLYAPQFLRDPGQVLGDARHTMTTNPGGLSQPWWRRPNLLSYVEMMIGQQLLPFFGALFIAALGWFVLTRTLRTTTKRVFLSALLVPYLFFSLVVAYDKTQRYTLPLVGVIGVVSALFVMSLRPAVARRILIALVVLVGLWQYWALSYAAPGYSCADGAGLIRSYFSSIHSLRLEEEGDWNVGMFRPYTWPSGIEEAVARIMGDASRGEEKSLTLIGTRTFFWPLIYLSHLREGPYIESHQIGDGVLSTLPEETDRTPDYFVTLSTASHEEPSFDPPRGAELEVIRLFEEQRLNYTLLASIPSFPYSTACSPGEEYAIEVYKRIH